MMSQFLCLAAILVSTFTVFVHGYVNESDFTEGQCFTAKTSPSHIRFDKEWALENFMPKAYVVMGSLLYINTLSSMIRHHNLETVASAADACISATGKLKKRVITGFGGTASITLSCNSTHSHFNMFRCLPVFDEAEKALMPKRPKPYIYPRHMTASWTNYKDTIVMIHCLTTNLRSWAAISTTTELTEDTKNAVLAHIKISGFNPENIVYANYEKCGFKAAD